MDGTGNLETHLKRLYASTSRIAWRTSSCPLGQRIFFNANCLYNGMSTHAPREGHWTYPTMFILSEINERKPSFSKNAYDFDCG